MEIEAYLPNKDIGFVAIGNRARVKVDAFPFTRYGAIATEFTERSPPSNFRSGRIAQAGQEAVDASGQRCGVLAELAGGDRHSRRCRVPRRPPRRIAK